LKKVFPQTPFQKLSTVLYLLKVFEKSARKTFFKKFFSQKENQTKTKPKINQNQKQTEPAPPDQNGKTKRKYGYGN
jgi:hypothetical protein